MADTLSVRIGSDERYPELSIDDEPADYEAVTIPKELLDRYVWAAAEWEQVQSEIRNYSHFSPAPFNGYLW